MYHSYSNLMCEHLPFKYTSIFTSVGMEQIIRRKSDEKAKVASVLLFTDGLANRGIKNMKEIIDAMKDPVRSLAKPGALDNPAGMYRPLVSMSL